jgi:hypothetical protein
MVLLGVARANTSVGGSPETFQLQSAPADWGIPPPLDWPRSPRTRRAWQQALKKMSSKHLMDSKHLRR